ncbi:MAG TPA: hypothetical protein VHM30_07995 [Gemmatimonadaceae bacterium]|nr:hypothetical protein [Gemmatimonadaceae bacterium]
MIAQGFIDAFAPWKTLYGDSPVVATTVTTVHVVALLFGGGFALATDRSTLRALRGSSDDRRRQLAELHAVHRPVLVALAMIFVSGLALATADLETFLGSPVFWVKLALVTLLVANGALLARTEARLLRSPTAPATTTDHSPLWRRLRFSTFASITLWTLTTIAGTALVGLS